MCDVFVLRDGYSYLNNDSEMCANCSCTLIKGSNNIIIDTMTPWDSEVIRNALEKHNINPSDIEYVISTHGHSDHTGNNNLFLNAKHCVGFSLSFKDRYYIHPFEKGEEYKINSDVKIIPTPGHTLSDVCVIVMTKNKETIAIAGDLFEKYEDIDNQSIWLEAGSENPKSQLINRSKVADLADWIVPGHGPMFQVTTAVRESLRRQLDSSL